MKNAKSLLKGKKRGTQSVKLFKKAGLYDLLSPEDQDWIEMNMPPDTANDFINNFVDPNHDEKLRKSDAIKLFRKRFRKK